MLIDAVRLPVALGVNVTLILHIPPTATDIPQVLVSEKSPKFAPPTVIPVMFNTAVPLLVNVTDSVAAVVPTN